jgi:hypothetical protein
MRHTLYSFLLGAVLLCSSQISVAQDRYTDGNYSDLVPTSPKEGWSKLEPIEKGEGSPIWSQILLWLPNRVLDLIDVFRIDVGVGPSFGAVVRATKYGEIGYRQMAPASLRVGDFGRQMPFLIESSNEFGVGPAYVNSSDRKVCPGEFGVGADLLVAGAYGGVCVDEFADFLAGIFFIDLKDDDI